MKQVSEEIGAYYQHYPRLAAVIGASHDGKTNAMVAAWHTPLSFSPPLFGVSIAPKRHTYNMIAQSGEFSVNFLPASNTGLLAALGGNRGSEIDKFTAFDISRDRALKSNTPILTDAYAAFECKLVEDRKFGDHQLLVGEIVAVHTISEAFTAGEILDLKAVTPAFYMGNDKYITKLKATVEAREREKFAQPGSL